MGQTASYYSDCYNNVARTEDGAVKAAERHGKVPMTKQGTCCKCSQTAIVVFYEYARPPHWKRTASGSRLMA